MAILYDDQNSRAAAAAITVANSDVYTIQGDCTTAGTAAIANRYLGAVGVLRGTLLFDGYCFEIDVANTTNAVVGLAITGSTSGATAVITQILSSTRIKFRYTNNLFFVNGGTLSGGSFSAAATSAPILSNITVLGLQNTSISGALQGVVKSSGCWWTLGTSNGTANQSFSAYTTCNFSAVYVQGGDLVSLASGNSTITAQHQFANGDAVRLVGTLTGSGLASLTTYCVINSNWDGRQYTTGTSFALSNTKGGGAVTPTASATNISVLKHGFSFSTQVGSSVFTCPAGHTLSVYSFSKSGVGGDSVTLTIPAANGLLEHRTYYVVAADQIANTFSLSLDPGGTPLSASATTTNSTVTPDSIYNVWLNVVDRTLVGSGSVAGCDRVHGRVFKQVTASNAITFGDAGSALTVSATFAASSNTITTGAAHGQAVGARVRFGTTVALPPEFSTDVEYYIVAVPTTTQIRVSTVALGTAIAASTTGSGTHSAIPQFGGRIPVNGARIVIPNICLGNTTAATAPTPGVITALTASAAWNLSSFVGSLDQVKANWFGIVTNVITISSVVFNYWQVYYSCRVISENGWKGLEFAVSAATTASNAADALNVGLSEVYIQGLRYLRHNTGSLSGAPQNTLIKKCFFATTRTGGGTNALTISGSIANFYLADCIVIGGGLVFTAVTNGGCTNYHYSDRLDGGSPNTSNTINAIGINNCRNLEITNISLGTPNGSSFFSFANNSLSYNIKIVNAGTALSPLSGGNTISNLVQVSTCIGLTVANVFFANYTGFSLQGLVFNLRLFNVFLAPFEININSGGDGNFLRGLRFANLYTGGNQRGTHYYDRFVSQTVGEIRLLFYNATSDFYSKAAQTVNGGSEALLFDGSGNLLLQQAGDSLTIQTDVIYGHSSLTSVSVSGTNASFVSGSTWGNHTIRYRIASGLASFAGAYKDFNSTNISGESVSASTGFRIQIQMSCLTLSSTNALGSVAVNTGSSQAAQSAISYPTNFAEITLSGLIAGSTVGLFDSLGNLVESGIASGTTYSFSAVPFVTSSNYTYKVRRYGYVETSDSFPLVDGSTVYLVFQIANPLVVLSSSAAAALSGITINYSSSLITISGTVTQQQLYDFTQSSVALLANIDKPIPLSTIDGLNLTLSFDLTIAVGASFVTTGSIGTGSRTVTLAEARVYNFAANIGATGKVIVTSGATDIRLFVFANGAKIDNSSASAATITVAATEVSDVTASSPTLGGGAVTIAAPATTISISGIPTGANAILGVIDLTTMVQTFPTIASGTATVVTDPTHSYFLACDARGYLREAVTLSGAVPSYTFNLTNFRSLYDAGVSRSTDIAFNTSTFEVIVSDGTPNLSLADVFHTIEDYLATPEAVFFSTPPYPVIVDVGGGSGRQYLFFPYDTVADTPNPVRIKPDPTNIIDPTLTDFVIVHEGSTAPLFSIFDFTAADGRTIRFQTDAVAANVVVSGSGALTTEQSSQLAALFATLQASGVFSTAALVNAPTGSGGGGSGLTAQQVADALKLAPVAGSAASGSVYERLTTINAKTTNLPASPASTADVQVTVSGGFLSADRDKLNAIPTNPLLTNDTRLNNLDATVSSRSTLSLTAIEASTVLAKQASVLAIPTNPLLASAYTAPDNASISTLTSRLTATRATNLDNLNATVSSRATPSDLQVTVSGGFESGDRVQLTALNATLATAGVFSTAALANAPTGTGGNDGLDAAGVRAAIGLAAANLDTQLAGININVDQIPLNPLLANDVRLNFLDASIAANAPANVWSATTRSLTDKVGFSLASTQNFNLIGNITGNLSGSVGSVTNAVTLPTIPNNWITATGVATDAVTKIQTGLSTYAGGDTAGVTTLLGRLTSGRAANLDNLNATITSRATPSDLQVTVSGGFSNGDRTTLQALPTLTQIEASTILFKADQYTAPNNTAIAAIKAKTDNLPALPASTSDVQVTVSGGFTNDDRATLGSIPTEKTGYTLTGAERTAIATAVETQLSSEFNTIPNVTEIRQELDTNSTRLSAIAINAELSRQGVSNRYKIDETNNTGTLYDDDGTTPLVVHSLTDKDGNPASESTYERVPQ